MPADVAELRETVCRTVMNIDMSGTVSIKQFSEQAKMLLETTALSVGDIARQVGIYNVSYFTQCFKKQERISPMKYRQQVSKGS